MYKLMIFLSNSHLYDIAYDNDNDSMHDNQQQNSVMNILQGIKPSKPQSTKFIIKSKPSVKQNKQCPDSQQSTYATNQDVHQLITYIVSKSKRLADLLETKGIADANQFYHLNLYQNPCVRTFLKSVMDKMLAERRLGKGLKGINKGILTEIENCIWTTIQRQISLYQLDKMYEKEKSTLQGELLARRKQIEQQMQSLKTQSLQKDLILKQNNQNEG